MAEAAGAIGKAIGKPGLSYVQFPPAQVEQAMVQMGLPVGTAKLLIEMSAAMNDGRMAPLEKRSARTTTPTSIETFAAEGFAPRYQGKATSA